MIYLLTKEYTLWAFEGPEKPELESKFEPHNKGKILSWETDMSTARESALPVVNASCMCKYESEALLFYIDKERIKIGPGETVPLPGWELEKVYQTRFYSELWQSKTEWSSYTKEHYDASKMEKREAYRLVRSEPLNVNQLKALDKGLERSELVKKEPIKLTFYSGKLWNSDKPFPVNKPIKQASPVGSSGVAKIMHSLKIERWLSTAYEVVNPEVIPGVDVMLNDGVMVRADETGNDIEPLQDGDELTLPEGYGIDTRVYRQRGEVNGSERKEATITTEKPKKSLRERIAEGECVSERGTDHCPVCIDSCDAAHHKRNIEELIDKPENSAHSFTEGSDCGGDNIIVNPVSIEEHCQGINCPFEYSCTNGCMYPVKPVVEPSESQEENQRDLAADVLTICRTYDGSAKSFVEHLDELTHKFTITRK